MIDYLANKYYNKKFDKNGQIASKGNVIDEMLKKIISEDEFCRKAPPKSTGREYYSENFINSILNKFKKADPSDILKTFTEFTAFAIHYNLKKINVDIDNAELIVSGGGAKNTLLMKYLKEYFKGNTVRTMNDHGINCDNKEAVLFAVLANELINGEKTNMPSVTGSDRKVFLGKISIA